MTHDEFDTVIAELIIPQEKTRSTGNSHRRKQWENQRYWRLCTMGMSCKLSYVKVCPIAKQVPLKHHIKSPTCWDCVCYGFSSPLIMGGVGYCCAFGTYYKRWSNNRKWLRVAFNRRFRRNFKGDVGNYGYYRRVFDYEWECV